MYNFDTITIELSGEDGNIFKLMTIATSLVSQVEDCSTSEARVKIYKNAFNGKSFRWYTYDENIYRLQNFMGWDYTMFSKPYTVDIESVMADKIRGPIDE